MSSPDLDGRIALVPAPPAVSADIARAFVEAGMRVALCDTAGEGVLHLQDKLGAGRTISLPTDVWDPASCSDNVNRRDR